MKSKELPNLANIEILFLSLGGVGFAPYAPGTFGTLVTLPLLYLIGTYQVPLIFFAPFFILLTVGSCLLCEACQKKYEVKDPSWIVIDELLGMVITWLFFPSGNILLLLVAFGFFRLFDITKPYPVKYFDNMKHGAGVVLDDLIAGIYAGICYLIFARFIFPFLN